MKVAITCDYLLSRSHYTEIIESLCEVFPDAMIYCFAHKKGAILGAIEMRSIRSTYLSNIVTTEEEFYEHSNKFPSLAKNLFVSCEYDLIINISKGFSQGFKKCKNTKLITYLYDLDLNSKIKTTFLQTLFYPFISSWVKKTLNQADMVFTSRQELLWTLNDFKTKGEIMPPPFRVSDYALFPQTMFKHDYFLIEARGINQEDARNIISWMLSWHYPFQFIGPDDHLAELKAESPASAFFGNRCSGEHAPVLAGSRALISFNDEDFPGMALATLATGRPVILTLPLKKWISGVGINFVHAVDHVDKDELHRAIMNLPAEDKLEPLKLRAHVMEYHDIKFKAQMKRTLDKIYHDLHKDDPQHPNDCSGCKS